VESTYLNTDMCKFESSQKDESTAQSAGSVKANPVLLTASGVKSAEKNEQPAETYLKVRSLKLK